MFLETEGTACKAQVAKRLWQWPLTPILSFFLGTQLDYTSQQASVTTVCAEVMGEPPVCPSPGFMLQLIGSGKEPNPEGPGVPPAETPKLRGR